MENNDEKNTAIEKVKTYLANIQDDEIVDMCSKHIASGGSATTFCSNLGIKFYQLEEVINNNPIFKTVIKMAKLSRKEWLLERLDEELVQLGTVNLAGAFDASGEVKNLEDMPEDVKKSIAGIDISYDKDGNKSVKMKFTDKQKSLDMLMKREGLYQQKIQVDTKITLESLLTKSFDESSE